MTNDMTEGPTWELGQYVRIWKNEGYEYGHIESFDFTQHEDDVEVMLVGDDGKEIYARVKDLEEGE